MSYTTQTFQSDVISDIYYEYKNEIAEIIAYIEVYEHDYPDRPMSQMAELFQCMANYETKDGDDKSYAKILLDDSFSRIEQYLYIHTIWLILFEIFKYKKVFRHFKYKGVYIEKDDKEENFSCIADEKEEEITTEFSEHLLSHYKANGTYSIFSILASEKSLSQIRNFLKLKRGITFKSFKKEPYIPLEFLNTNNLTELKQTFKKAKDLLEYYQKAYSDVVSNGKTISFKSVCFNILANILFPLGMTVITIWNIVNFFK